MKIFYARAYIDYNTQFEYDNIKLIKGSFGEDIIKIPILEHTPYEKYGKGLYEKEKKHFFPLIDECDIFIMSSINNELNKDRSKRSDKGKLTEGVKFEALYALSIGKEVYKIDENKITQIKSIRKSEELIKSIYLLNKKYNIFLDNNMKKLMNNEERLPANIHPKIIGLYERNPIIIDLMKDFLTGNRKDIKYVKPIAIQIRYPTVEAPIRYLPFGTKTHFTLSDLSIVNLKRYKGEMHLYKAFFDTKILEHDRIEKEIQEEISKLIKKGRKPEDFKPWMIFNKYILGFGVIFDIDAPKSLESIVGKANMFDDKWYNEFITVKKETEKEIDKILKLKYVCSTTGNGFNIICEPYWFDERDDNLYDFINTINDIVGDINISVENKVSGVRIDEKIMDWSMYKKMPFTYHAKWNRITLPVSRGEIEKDWLSKISDIDNFLKNESDSINEVIQRSKWEKYKWW